MGFVRPRETRSRSCSAASSRSPPSPAHCITPDAEPVAVFVVRGVALGGLAWAIGIGDRVGRRPFRAGCDRRAPVDARQPSRAVHRPLLARRRRDRRRPDVDPRLAVRERAPRARPRDRRGRAPAEDGVMRFQPRLPNDTATLLLLAVFIIVLLGLSDQARRPGEPASGRDLDRSAPSACSSSTPHGSGRTCAPRAAEPAIEQPAHAVLPLRIAIVAARRRRRRLRRSSPTGSSTRSTRRSRRSASRRRSPAS